MASKRNVTSQWYQLPTPINYRYEVSTDADLPGLDTTVVTVDVPGNVFAKGWSYVTGLYEHELGMRMLIYMILQNEIRTMTDIEKLERLLRLCDGLVLDDDDREHLINNTGIDTLFDNVLNALSDTSDTTSSTYQITLKCIEDALQNSHKKESLRDMHLHAQDQTISNLLKLCE